MRPTHVSSRTPNRQLIVKRNPFWKDSVYKRPHNFDTIDYEIGNSLTTIQLDVESGRSDYAGDGLPPTAYAAYPADQSDSRSARTGAGTASAVMA